MFQKHGMVSLLLLLACTAHTAWGWGAAEWPYTYKPPITPTGWIINYATFPLMAGLAPASEEEEEEEKVSPRLTSSTRPQKTAPLLPPRSDIDMGEAFRVAMLIEVGNRGYGKETVSAKQLPQYTDIRYIGLNSPVNPPFVRLRFDSGRPRLWVRNVATPTPPADALKQ